MEKHTYVVRGYLCNSEETFHDLTTKNLSNKKKHFPNNSKKVMLSKTLYEKSGQNCITKDSLFWQWNAGKDYFSINISDCFPEKDDSTKQD